MATCLLERCARRLDDYLHRENVFTALLSGVEEKTGIGRTKLVLGVMVYCMLVEYGVGLVCHVVGHVYPAYMSFKALESRGEEGDVRWLTYWIVSALFSVPEYFLDVLLGWLPVYWPAKWGFLVWCLLPAPWGGAVPIYLHVVKPLFLRHEGHVDRVMERARIVLAGISSPQDQPIRRSRDCSSGGEDDRGCGAGEPTREML